MINTISAEAKAHKYEQSRTARFEPISWLTFQQIWG